MSRMAVNISPCHKLQSLRLAASPEVLLPWELGNKLARLEASDNELTLFFS